MSGKGRARRCEEEDDERSKPRYAGWVYFKGPMGSDPVRKEMNRLPSHVKAELEVRMRRFRDGTFRRQDYTPLDKGVHELRYRKKNNHYRLLFAVWGDRLVALDVFYKNQNKTDSDRAEKRWRDWRDRNGEQPSASG